MVTATNATYAAARAAKAARSGQQQGHFERPAFFTPVDKKPREQPSQAELDAQFAIPSHVLAAQESPKK